MLASKVKDLKARINFHTLEKISLVNKFIFVNTLNSNASSEATYFFVKKMEKNKNSKTKVIRRCIFNNRGRGVTRSFGISRIYLRELLQFGQIPGFSKAIW